MVQGYIFTLCPFSPCSPAFDIISSSVSPLTTTQQHEQIRVFPGNFPARQRAMVHPTHTMTCSDSRDRLIIPSIFGLFYGFSFGGQFARAATWLIESAGKQSGGYGGRWIGQTVHMGLWHRHNPHNQPSLRSTFPYTDFLLSTTLTIYPGYKAALRLFSPPTLSYSPL